MRLTSTSTRRLEAPLGLGGDASGSPGGHGYGARLAAGIAIAALLGASALVGCGDQPNYELRWTLGCSDGTGPCEVTSARDCSSVGIGQIEVAMQRETRTSRRVFSCFSAADGPAGIAQGLGAGPVELTVTPLSAAGRKLPVEPAQTTAEIPQAGSLQLTIDLPVPPACADGVDNDADGQVDRFDPGCDDDADTDEAQ